MDCTRPLLLAIGLALAGIALCDEGRAQAVFTEAQGLEERREWKAAITAYRQAVMREAESRELAARALLRIGACLQAMGRLEEADAAYIQLLWMYPEQKEMRDEVAAKVGEGWRIRTDQDLALERLLKSPCPAHVFEGQTLEEAVEWFRSTFRLNAVIDPRAPEYAPEGADARLRIEIAAGTVEEAFTNCLEPYGMVWIPEQGCVVVEVRQTCGNYHPHVPERRRDIPEWEADDPPWKADRRLVVNRLRRLQLQEDIEGEGLRAIADGFASQTGERVVVDEELDEGIRLHGKTVIRVGRADRVLNALALTRTDWYVDAGVIHITTREKAEEYRRAHER